MTVDLPSVQVTAAQRDRIYAAYKGKYSLEDDGVEEAVKAEIINTLNRTVVEFESTKLRQEADQELQDRLVTLNEGLPEAPIPSSVQDEMQRQANVQAQIDHLNAANAQFQ